MNLALRLRKARKYYRQGKEKNYPQGMLDHMAGCENEAWNSFQAAKAIYVAE